MSKQQLTAKQWPPVLLRVVGAVWVASGALVFVRPSAATSDRVFAAGEVVLAVTLMYFAREAVRRQWFGWQPSPRARPMPRLLYAFVTVAVAIALLTRAWALAGLMAFVGALALWKTYRTRSRPSAPSSTIVE